jgi:hypothetical protein
MNTYNYNDHDHQPRHPLVPQKQNIERERMCVNGKLNFKSNQAPTATLSNRNNDEIMFFLCVGTL